MNKLTKLLLLITLCFNTFLAKNQTVKIEFISYSNTEFSFENLKNYLNFKGVKNTDIVLRQAILETGHFKSYSFKKRNNLFGLTGFNGLMKFSKWQDCVDRYLTLQQKTYKDGCYYTYLEKLGYAEDENYIEKLKNINLKRYEKTA